MQQREDFASYFGVLWDIDDRGLHNVMDAELDRCGFWDDCELLSEVFTSDCLLHCSLV